MSAYPKAKYDSARANAATLLANANIAAEVSDRLNALHMSADEALTLLTDQARGDIGQLMDVSTVGFTLDLYNAKEAGLTRLIKRVKQKTTIFQAKSESQEDREVTETEIELYDSQSALINILKIHGKFVDRQDITSGGEKIVAPIIYIPSNGRD
jgi:hypothetical protein